MTFYFLCFANIYNEGDPSRVCNNCLTCLDFIPHGDASGLEDDKFSTSAVNILRRQNIYLRLNGSVIVMRLALFPTAHTFLDLLQKSF